LLLLELFFSWRIVNDSPNQTQIPTQDPTYSAQDTTNSKKIPTQNTTYSEKIFFKARHPANVVGSPWQGV